MRPLLDDLIRPLQERRWDRQPEASAVLRLRTSSNVLSRSNAPFMFGDVQEGPLLLRQSHVP